MRGNLHTGGVLPTVAAAELEGPHVENNRSYFFGKHFILFIKIKKFKIFPPKKVFQEKFKIAGQAMSSSLVRFVLITALLIIGVGVLLDFFEFHEVFELFVDFHVGFVEDPGLDFFAFEVEVVEGGLGDGN